MTVIERAEWGAQPGKRPLAGWGSGQPSSKTAHYEGTDIIIFGKTRDDYSRMVRAIQAFHLSTPREDYSDIAYNFVVSPIGDVYVARGRGFRSGAQAAGNPVSLAVCYIGGPTTDFTADAQDAFLAAAAGVGGPWHPHSFWLPTGCPGDNIRFWIDHGTPGAQPCVCPPQAAPATPGGKQHELIAAMQDQDRRGVVLTFNRERVNEDARDWQRALNETSNAHLVADGRFGIHTSGATLDFQRFWRLAADGKVGAKTRGAMLFVLAHR